MQLRVGLKLLPENSWQNNYDLTLALYVEAVEAEYLNTNYERSAALAEVVLKQASTLLERVKVYELQIQYYMAQNQMLKAIDTGLPVLDMLGVSLSNDEGGTGGFVVELPYVEDLENIPEMTDPYKLAALRILMSVISPAYAVKPEIVPVLVLDPNRSYVLNMVIQHRRLLRMLFMALFIYSMTGEHRCWISCWSASFKALGSI